MELVFLSCVAKLFQDGHNLVEILDEVLGLSGLLPDAASIHIYVVCDDSFLLRKDLLPVLLKYIFVICHAHVKQLLLHLLLHRLNAV